MANEAGSLASVGTVQLVEKQPSSLLTEAMIH